MGDDQEREEHERLTEAYARSVGEATEGDPAQEENWQRWTLGHEKLLARIIDAVDPPVVEYESDPDRIPIEGVNGDVLLWLGGDSRAADLLHHLERQPAPVGEATIEPDWEEIAADIHMRTGRARPGSFLPWQSEGDDYCDANVAALRAVVGPLLAPAGGEDEMQLAESAMPCWQRLIY